MERLKGLEAQMLAAPDQQISLTDPDSRSMATSGRGSGVVGYNVQVAVDTEHHLIVTHEVTNVGSDRVAARARGQGGQSHAANGQAGSRRRPRLLQRRGNPGVRASRHHGHAAKADDVGRQGARAASASRTSSICPRRTSIVCPAGERLTYRYTTEENGLMLRRYWTNACRSCAIKQPLHDRQRAPDHAVGA